MNSRTLTLILPVAKERLFAYLSRIENLPKWATEFCRELKRVDGRYKAVTCDPEVGEIFISIQADEVTGVIDFFAGPDPDQMGIAPTRVIGLPGNSSAYVFTMFQAPGMPDGKFEQQYRSLGREFENLKREFGALAAAHSSD